MILIKSFLTRVLYDCFKLIYAYLNERDEVRECYSCLKTMIQGYLHVAFFTMSFIKHASSLKWFYLYMKLLQSSLSFKQKNNHEVTCGLNFCMKIFTTPNSKNMIVSLHIVTIEKPALTFLLMSYFHVSFKDFFRFSFFIFVIEICQKHILMLIIMFDLVVTFKNTFANVRKALDECIVTTKNFLFAAITNYEEISVGHAKSLCFLFVNLTNNKPFKNENWINKILSRCTIISS